MSGFEKVAAKVASIAKNVTKKSTQLARDIAYPVYEKKLIEEVRDVKHPRHVAVMCDGNRRWAREAGFADVSHGHRVGAKKIGEMVRWAENTGVETVTVYLLSTENLGRSSDELQLLFDIIVDVAEELSDEHNNCQVKLVGHLDLLPQDFRTKLKAAVEPTKAKTGICVNIAVGYGGRQEIVDAVQHVIRDAAARGIKAEDMAEAITVDSISSHLYTSGQPDPDLVIRTSGEQRLSGFMLWQSAYSEIWFTDTYWPAFRQVDFLRALREYSKRSRRFGK